MKRIKMIVFLFSVSAFLLVDKVSALEPEGIIGGEEARIGEYSYQITVQVPGRDICGGSILNENYIITAAHCVADEDSGFFEGPIRIVGGTNDLNSDICTRVRIGVEKVFIPAEYMDDHHNADIAILKLKQPLNLESNPNLSKVNLPEGKSYDGENAIVTGFGWNWVDVEVDSATGDVLDENGDSDDKMRFAETTVYSLTECLEKSGETWINEKHICAGVIQRSSTKSEGVCIGDSGSPLVYKGNTIIGVVADSPEACDEKKMPTIYTRVFAYIDFIQKAIDNQCDSSILSTTVKMCED